MTAMAKIFFEGVTKEFGDEVVAVDDLSLEIEDGEFMVLVGPSGCGKSTILRMLAGLEEVTAGEIWIDDKQVTDLSPKERDIAMVFQNYALYPHMTVEENIAFGLKLRRVPKDERLRKAREVAQVLAIEHLLERKPAALSGGQRQRVAMGRAMIREPVAFLMDEPLSNLDAKLRVQMRAELARLHDRLRTTTVYVTHDQVEAMTLGDRVAVLRDGLLQQVDTPQRLFARPTNLFVAAFVGSPPMNLVEGTVEGGAISFAGFHVPLGEHTDLSGYQGRTVIVGIRPSDLEDSDVWAASGATILDVEVDITEELGSEVNVLFTVDAPPVTSEDALAAASDEGADDILPLITERAQFCARVDARTRAKPGERVRLAVDPTRFHFFEPETGLAISSDRKVPATA
jgi:multiple sugar transport system ATP-binding protein